MGCQEPYLDMQDPIEMRLTNYLLFSDITNHDAIIRNDSLGKFAVFIVAARNISRLLNSLRKVFNFVN